MKNQPFESTLTTFFHFQGKHAEDEAAAEDEDECLEYDEFGFKLEMEDGPEQSSSKLLSMPFKDNPQQRLKWLAHLEFAQTYSKPMAKGRKQEVVKDDSSSKDMTQKGPLAWDTMVEGITRTNKLR